MEVIDVTIVSRVKQTLATLKGSQGTLRLYALQTTDEETKLVYNEAVTITEKIINELEERIQTLEYQEPQYKGN